MTPEQEQRIRELVLARLERLRREEPLVVARTVFLWEMMRHEGRTVQDAGDGGLMESTGRGRHFSHAAYKRNQRRERAAVTLGMVRRKSAMGDEFVYPD